MVNSVYWLIALALLIFIEIVTLGLTTIWFAGGALVAFIVSLFFDNLLVEIILFLLVSMILLFFTRPLVLKYFNPKKTRTNYQAVIGKEAYVIIAIDNISATGQVVVDGQEWSAKSKENVVIEKGTKVIIHDVVGVKLIVSQKREEL